MWNTLLRSSFKPFSMGRRLDSARIALRKQLGQHLLISPQVVKGIVDAAEIQPFEHVFEIGPGSGNLTIHLLERARVVSAVELDEKMHATVNHRVEKLGFADKFYCVRGDFMRVPLPPFDVLVANIPYQISSPVVDRLFHHRELFSRAVIMFQKEFGERMMAKPGTKQYCRLSVNTQMWCDVTSVMIVKKRMFRPPPAVDSIVVKMVPKQFPEDIDFEEWNAMLRFCFMGKNKTMRSLFKISAVVEHLEKGFQSRFMEGLATDASPPTGEYFVPLLNREITMTEAVNKLLKENDLDNRRANGMTQEEFKRLYFSMLDNGLHFLN